ncbi:IgGFc-binding protein-like [Haliotis rufescens]|uniref:IgGFc-binding protein-like n=1 Tax=Haliotis rufescens TaxID=6454 RepID=UPI00201EA536|nr:IgGFc-binding protein-like [Haliotis rufescens]
MRARVWHTCLLALILSLNPGCFGNAGSDFVFAFIQVYHTNDSYDYLVLTPTTDQGAEVRVIAPGYPNLVNETIILAPGQIHSLKVHGAMAMNYGSYIDRRGIHVTSSHHITVVGIDTESWKGSGSNYDSFLVRPTDQLGNEYYAVCYYITNSAAGSTFAVVATNNDTLVSITLTTSDNVTVTFDSDTYSNGDIITRTLEQYDVLQIQTRSDLTGSHVIANKPITAYSGVNRTRVHFYGCSSTMVDQLPPVNVWGKDYVTVPFPNRMSGDIYRVLASWANTALYVYGIGSYLLREPGNWMEFYLENATYVRANKPVQVAQLSVSRTSDEGDPSLLILSPIDAARTSYVFGVSVTGKWRYYVAVVIQEFAIAGLLFNNQSVNVSNVSVEQAEGSQYAIVYIELMKSAYHNTITHEGHVSFLAYVYSGEKCKATAHSLGTAASTLFAACAPTYGYPGDGVDNDCDGVVDEEACCVNKDGIDDDLDMVVDEDCYAPPGVEMSSVSGHAVCCRGDTTYLCEEIVRNGHFKRMGDKKYLATDMAASHTRNKQQCFHNCGREKDCWALNYHPPSLSGDGNCELLRGAVTGSTQEGSWTHYQLDRSWSQYVPL